ncbi:hypothetical protein [Actinomadura keratinilytica]|jgi:hypothetical protein|uniref:hypothetical protein n=1 Tax=Actinomadura keratinilytica TaxID=547461 RepID=UPI00360C6B90
MVELYAWDLSTPDGLCGVTDSRAAAIGHVTDALRKAEDGTRGVVRRVALSPSGRPVYIDLGPIARARREDKTGAIIWEPW